jgi:hypothetical protein
MVVAASSVLVVMIAVLTWAWMIVSDWVEMKLIAQEHSQRVELLPRGQKGVAGS